MSSSSLIQAAIFAAGAIVGGGVTAVVTSKRQRPVEIVSPNVQPAISTVSPPVIDLGAKGNAEISSAVSLAPLASSALKYGNPGPIADLTVKKAYVAAYDRRLRHPAWTAEHLTLASLGKSALVAPPSPEEAGDRTKSAFIEDESIPLSFRARLQDYFRSGYDRGHMVPAADAKFSQEAMNETFLLSNIAPQVGDGFNRHYWAYLEDWCRRLTASFADVYVFTVPLYLPHRDHDGKWRVTHEVIGSPPNVAVPTHFAKVVLTSKPSSPSTPDILELATGAFVLPNAPIPDETPLEKFVMPVDAVERAAGLTLFSEAVKNASKHICKSTKCEVIVRRFDDARKRPEIKRAVSAP
ncbi:mitochondrial nuclease [Moniliophthora roreri MCA 2997]|uniref:Endonuclease n=2 Tax=Moniliophthora roreri TaxID=221103 RepID=V2X504_MONRO|nr:mitochondrial nuclease [Moniliophthora roreri MCA 2997]KAI3610740.1 mitochondrial nuclease [Moniliophthora roreri]